MTRRGGDEPGEDFSLGRLALSSLGAAAAVLAVVTVVIVVLKPAPGVGLAIALLGVVAAIAAMGFVSVRTTRRAFGRDGRQE
ncbi:hypothetical protein [Rhodococcus chondri]|uniref:Uncharacterized protein n=1 Tax=Rhodococcus chondri TaxID=3065941 RepID=A0ABU7JX27_9NOCA|nr:hypothetical protein [Rhodococcus sp. CC-R104]MEE2034579.1 hypothetical protein [Rhodococcus sp. CC-R104]